MNEFSRFLKKLSLLFSRGRFRSDLDEEMAFHRAEAEKELRARGMTAEDACDLVLREAGQLIGIGIAAGLALSIGAAVLMRKLLFGVAAWDAATLAGVAGLLAACALVSTYLPARRAGSVSPAQALRTE